MSYETLLVEQRGAVTLLTLNRPQALNALNSQVLADMVAAVPGAYAWLGATPGPGLHNASFDFDDSLIPLGSAYLARVVERRARA